MTAAQHSSLGVPVASPGGTRRRPFRPAPHAVHDPLGAPSAAGSALLRMILQTAGWLAAALLLGGCATGWVQQGDRLVDAERGLSISLPPEGRWEVVPVEGSALTLRRADGTTLSWLKACAEEGERAPASAQAAARGLLQSVGQKTIAEEGPIAVGRGEAWRIEAVVHDGDRTRRLSTVTRTDGRCTEDWVLTAPYGTETAGLLDAWWASVDGPQVAAESPGSDALGRGDTSAEGDSAGPARPPADHAGAEEAP